jgi:glucokinase
MGILAVDIGGTNIRTALFRTPREQLAAETIACRTLGRPVSVNRFVDYLETRVQELESDYEAVDAVGLAAAAVVDHHTGFVRVGENIGWQNVPLRALIGERLNRPVHIDVDAFCGALAEARLGAGLDQVNFLYVVIGTGIGHGLVLDRQVWHGMHAAANVFGHMKVLSDGAPCYCGGHGCLCQYASGVGLAQRACELSGHNDLTGADVVQGWRDGASWAHTAVDTMQQVLAIALSHSCNLLDVECIVLGGGVVQSDFPDLADLHRRLEAAVYPEIRPLVLRRAALGDDAVLIGAALNGYMVLEGKEI